MARQTYGKAILEAHEYLLETYPEVFIFGQGLWSPWYVGSTMKDLDKKFGRDRVIDSPVSEVAVTGAAVGASLCGYRPVVVHPRMDFMILAIDQIVSQAAKWSSMFGGQAHPCVTIRGIINRGGEQGAQHSQALHSWFSHIPGLRVVMPTTVADARDLFISSVLSDDPVMFIDDRWLYDQEDNLEPIQELPLSEQGPKCLKRGQDITIVGCGYGTKLALDSVKGCQEEGYDPEIIDLRILNPIDYEVIVKSVSKTGRLLVIDAAWANCSISSEIMAGVSERLSPAQFKSSPQRLNTVNAPAPTSKVLEDIYYPSESEILKKVIEMIPVHEATI